MRWIALLLLVGCPKKAPRTPTVDYSLLHGTMLEQPKPLIGSFRATSHDGSPRDMADLMGHPTVIWFFPAANTSGCTVEGCGYRDLFGEFDALGVKIVGVSFTDLQTNQEWAKRLEFPYEIWRDDDRSLATYYDSVDGPDAKYPKRRTRVLNAEGKVVLEYNDKIIVGAHPADVLEDVKMLAAAGKL